MDEPRQRYLVNTMQWEENEVIVRAWDAWFINSIQNMVGKLAEMLYKTYNAYLWWKSLKP